MWRATVALCLAGLAACGSPERRLRKALAHAYAHGVVRMPPGVVEVSEELKLPDGARDIQIIGSAGSVLRASPRFQGRAILSCTRGRRISFRSFTIEGNRSFASAPQEMAPPENAFRIYYQDNGILADQTEGLEVSGVRFLQVRNFPVVVSRCREVRIQNVTVDSCGSRNRRRRNNTTGGIVIEEGTADFRVVQCVFRNVPGNALWTHSLYTSPRNADGVFAQNRFENIGRDAVQVGHATRVAVVGNQGTAIGFPIEDVDVEGGGTPVAIDTAGNVDQTTYADNRFAEVNGKCLDLDGFHDGEVRGNTCLNGRPPEAYPAGQFGIVMNNNNPDMRSQNVRVLDNVIDGAKFGGIFVIGTGHRIAGNRLLHLNTAHCNENAARFGCYYLPGEPELLESGIYLGRGVKRLEDARHNTVEKNVISGYRMRNRCIAMAPGISARDNLVRDNRCLDEPER